MATAEFRTAIWEPWTSLEPVRVGKVPSGVGTPDLYVIIDAGEKLLRVDAYLSLYECGGPFQEVVIWRDIVVIGCCHHVFLVPLQGDKVATIDLDGYFGQVYLNGEVLLVASQYRLFRLSPNGKVIWTSQELGIDGVKIDRIQDGLVHGRGEWDPPDGWKEFAVRLDSGEFRS